MTSRTRALATIAIGAVVLIGLFAAGQLGGLRLNRTPSYPLGIWRIVPLEREVAVGDLVFICPPPTSVFVAASDRGYLRSGLCPGGMSPLIKTVVATAGQHISVDRSVRIDGAPLPHSDVRATDAGGKPLTPYIGGVVPAGRLFLHSPFSGSYDSRYFGPIPADGILGLARPLFVQAR